MENDSVWLENPPEPRSHRDPEPRQKRRALLSLSHVVPLAKYTAYLRQSGWGEVPDFDPLGRCGVARILFPLEKPGPMTPPTGKWQGSGFISRDNDDPTAEATFCFTASAGIVGRTQSPGTSSPVECAFVGKRAYRWRGTSSCLLVSG